MRVSFCLPLDIRLILITLPDMALRAETGFDHAAEVAALTAVERGEEVARIQRAWRAYLGESPKPLKVPAGSIDDNVQLSSAKVIVDTGVSFLFGGELSFGEDQEAVEAVVQNSGGPLVWQRLAVSGAIGGTAFIRLRPDNEGAPRFVVLDPENVEIIFDPADHEIIWGYIISWLEAREETTVACRQRIIRSETDSWEIIDEESRETGAWIEVSRELWGYEWCPVDHCQNMPLPSSVTGMSDLEPDVLSLSQNVDRTSALINRILRLYSYPRTVATGVGTKLDIDSNPGSVLLLENPAADIKNLEMSSDLGSSIAYHKMLSAQLYQLARIPEVATGKLDSAGQLSSLALKVMYAPLISKTETKRRTYGGLMERVIPRALEMAGVPLTGERLTIGWPSMVPVDDLSDRQVAVIDQQLGISKDTIIERLGYDPVVERAQRMEDRAENADQFNAGGFPPLDE